MKSPKASYLDNAARVCTVHWLPALRTAVCPRTAAEGRRLICLTPTVYPGAFVCCVDDLFVDLLVTGTDCYYCRYFVHPAQPIYGWWFKYTWSNVIGPALAPFIQILKVKTVAKVDELLACQVRRRES